jgi:hypothetical protein
LFPIETGRIVPLFHPRRQSWSEHFTIGDDGAVRGLTGEGRATAQLLEMNDSSRVSLRLLLLHQKRHR